MWESYVAGRQQRGHFSPVATASIATGVLVMILSVAILRGFQSEIERKVVGFGSHLVVRSYETTDDYGTMPVEDSPLLAQHIAETEGVAHVHPFAEKGAMIKTADELHGILFKGVGPAYDTTFFHNAMVEGRCPRAGAYNNPSNEVMLSSTIAGKLKLKCGDKLRTYFWQGDNYRARAFSITGIYNTDMTEFDELYVLGDIAQIQKINGWDSNQVGGYEINVDDFGTLNATAERLMTFLPFEYSLSSIVELNPTLFAWLRLLNSNIWLIIGVMSIVCIVAMISTFLIMVFSSTSTIGLLKIIGADNVMVKRIFILRSARITTTGIVIGNLLAALFCILQSRYHIVTLDSASYSMSYVPIAASVWLFLTVSIGTLIATTAALLIPAHHISHITPAQAIRVN